MSFSVNQIGTVHADKNGFYIEVEPQFREALTALDGFGYIQVIWWFDGCDNEQCRSVLTVEKPYTSGPEVIGTFATRSPQRPNPIAVTPAYVTYIDQAKGIVGLGWIDANDGTPVLDIKPYTPSVDRVEEPIVPKWCEHWPDSLENSQYFDWESEFNF